MTKEILMATTNRAKIDQIGGALSSVGITVVGVENKEQLPEVVEDGKTAMENARKKALAYSKVLGRTVLSMDNSLYFDKLEGDERQPALNVRRIPNTTEKPNDKELLDYYSNLVSGLGGEADARWEYGVCVASPDGTTHETVFGYKTRFIEQPSEIIMEGYPLESLQKDQETGKYRAEMTKEELAQFWQKKIGQPLSEFIASINI